MNRSVIFKLGAIALLIALLMIPLMQIGGVIRERQRLRDQVVQDIARSSSYNQRINGPLLVVPYRKTLREWKVHPKTEARYIEEREVDGKLYFLPETFKLNGRLKTELRARGIYQTRLYHAANQLSGYFELPVSFGVGADAKDYRFDHPYLAIGISDIRGIENALVLQFADQQLKFQPGTKETLLGSGVHVTLPLTGATATQFEFAVDIKLQGTAQLDIAPVGRETEVTLTADWPHPSFVGDYLPVERNIRSDGFYARWATSFFSTNLEEALQACAHQGSCDEFNRRQFGVEFVDPVDQYLKSERAIKYALLFIALTFAGFFVYEVLRRLAIHPIQYGMVGMSLALFYLLLLSLAEHVGFATAYALSTTGCVGLLGFYIRHVLQSTAMGLSFAAALGALYGVLYVLLSAEDYALLMGALLLFALLAIVMIVTRNVNWFAIGNKQPAG